MGLRTFQFRLHRSHSAPHRSTEGLVVEFLNDQRVWEPQPLSPTMPGFRLYLISLLLCQHFYLVANALERHIPLQAVEADFVVTTSHDWIVTARVDSCDLLPIELTLTSALPCWDQRR